MNRVPSKSKHGVKAAAKTSKKSMSTKLKQSKVKKVVKKVSKVSKSAAFLSTPAARGLWDTPQDAPGAKVEPYVDFYKDTPVNGLAEQLVRDMRDFFLIQTGSPQFFDRDYEQQKLHGKEQFAAIRKQMADNNYSTFQGYDELQFQTSYYKRVNMRPAQIEGESELRLDPNVPFLHSIPNHLVKPSNMFQSQYIDFRNHELAATGYVSAGPYYVPRNKFEFPLLSIDNDFLFFHD